jgi:hypothetical protein
LCGYETWSSTPRKEIIFAVSWSRVLRKIFVPEGKKVSQGLGKFYSEELISVLQQMLLMNQIERSWIGNLTFLLNVCRKQAEGKRDNLEN